MKAMILAAGRGQRMMPLTGHTPKPLLKVAGKPLLQYHIENLVAAGFNELVINVAYLGQQIEDFFSDGSQWGAHIHWSREETALETAGGLRKALPLLGNKPFLVVNGDVWTDFPFEKLSNSPHIQQLDAREKLAHLLLVNNPSQNPNGDFGLSDSLLLNKAGEMWTYSGIGLYHPALIEDCPLDEASPLAPLIRTAADKGLITAELLEGEWHDIGTPERLEKLDKALSEGKP